MSTRVFVSSTSGALADYRTTVIEVCRRLGIEPVFMEEFDPRRDEPLETCRQKVESCDVFVLLLAHRYGAKPPGSALSFTELEYRWALNRPSMIMLPFVVDPDFSWR